LSRNHAIKMCFDVVLSRNHAIKMCFDVVLSRNHAIKMLHADDTIIYFDHRVSFYQLIQHST